MSCSWREAHLRPELMRLNPDHQNDGLGWKAPFLGKSGMALLMSVVLRLNKISLVCTWQSDLSHWDQGPRGDMLIHRAMSYTAVLIRGDKDITLGYRAQGKLRSSAGNQGKHLPQHIVLSKG